MWKKDNKICDLTILNFILFFQKSEPLKTLDKLQQIMYEIFAN